MTNTVYNLLTEKYQSVSSSSANYSIDVLTNPQDTLKTLWEKYNINYVVDTSKFVECISVVRQIHIINVYLLGIAMLDSILSSNEIDDVAEMWAFLSLAHDIGYLNEIYEDVETKNLSLLCQEKGWDNFFQNANHEFYSNNTYIKYFEYMAEKMGRYEHGIVGALMIWSKRDLLNNNKLVDICYMIASHNIYLSKNPIYKEYALDEILLDKNRCVKLPKSYNLVGKIYLALILCDILEPINIFDYLLPKDNAQYLQRISYVYMKNSLTIMSDDPRLETIYERISDMGNWLNVKVVKNINSIIISWR